MEPLYRLHDWLMRSRLDGPTGLAASLHPFEVPVPVDSAYWTAALNATLAEAASRGYEPQVPEGVASAPNYPGDDTMKAMLFQLDCLRGAGYDAPAAAGACPFRSVDPLFNAALLRSNVALEHIVSLLVDYDLSIGDVRGEEEAVSAWSVALAGGLAKLWDGKSYSSLVADAAGGLSAAPATLLGSLYGPSFSVGANERTTSEILEAAASSVASAQHLLTPSAPGSFQCGSKLPATDADCGSAAGQLWLPGAYLAQRGLSYSGEESLAAWMQRSAVAPLCGAEPWSDFRAAKGAEGLREAEGSFTFARAFDSASGEPLPDEHGTGSSMGAAIAVLLLSSDGADPQTTSPPISHALTFALMVVELVIAFGIGVSCFVFSMNLIRRLQKQDREHSDLPFALGESARLVRNEASFADADFRTGSGDYLAVPTADADRADHGFERPQQPAAVQQAGLGGMLSTYTAYLRLW